MWQKCIIKLCYFVPWLGHYWHHTKALQRLFMDLSRWTIHKYCELSVWRSRSWNTRKWIGALPNDPASFQKQIWDVTHFKGEWVKTRGGKQPLNPPSIFPGVQKSCLKQLQSKERSTKVSSAETLRQSHEATNQACDKIINFKNFVKEIIFLYFPSWMMERI